MEKNSSIEQVFETIEQDNILKKQNSVLKGIIVLCLAHFAANLPKTITIH